MTRRCRQGRPGRSAAAIAVLVAALSATTATSAQGAAPPGTILLKGGGPAALVQALPGTIPALLGRLAGLDARLGTASRRAAPSCAAATSARRRAVATRQRALRGARRAGTHSLTVRIELISKALVAVGRSDEACAAPPAPAAPAVGVASAPPSAPVTVPVMLSSVVSGEPLDLQDALGTLVLPANVAPVDRSALEGPACRSPGAVCLGLDRTALEAGLRELIDREQLRLAVANLGSLNLGGLLTQLMALLGGGELAPLVSVQRAGDRELSLTTVGPLAQLQGLTDVPDVVIGILQIVPPSPAPAAPPAAPAGSVAQPALGQGLIDALNRARAARRLPPLRRSAPLARPAQAQSGRLSALGYLAHQGAGGAPFYTRLVAVGVSPLQPMGENLAMVPGCDPGGAREAVRLWLASPPHRANMLSRRFSMAGAGAASSPGCVATYYIADFAGPANVRRRARTPS